MWRHNDVIGRNEYLIFTLSESINSWVGLYSLQFLFKSTNNPCRYERKCEWVFFWTQCILTMFCWGTTPFIFLAIFRTADKLEVLLRVSQYQCQYSLAHCINDIIVYLSTSWRRFVKGILRAFTCLYLIAFYYSIYFVLHARFSNQNQIKFVKSRRTKLLFNTAITVTQHDTMKTEQKVLIVRRKN